MQKFYGLFLLLSAFQFSQAQVVAPGDIVINQLSPDYNGANDEYIELVNKTNNDLSLSGLAIRYQSSGGGSGSAGGALSGTIARKRYWLLSPNATITVGQTNNLARDGAITAGFAFPSGQIALVRVSDGVIIDAVGYGTITGGTYTEGTAASAPPTDGGLRRSPNGADNNNNSTDFVTVANAAIFLRSSAVGSPLPVKLTNLKAVQKGSAVQISWSNASETNIRDYTAERSINSVDFTPMLKMAPTNNLQSGADYLALDASPVKGANYYRIRSTETDGKTTFSGIVKLNTSGATAAGLLFYPNPVTGAEMTLQLSNLPAGGYTVRIIGVDGRILTSKMMAFAEGSSTESLPVNNLPAGIYTLQLQGQVSSRYTFIKQ